VPVIAEAMALELSGGILCRRRSRRDSATPPSRVRDDVRVAIGARQGVRTVGNLAPDARYVIDPITDDQSEVDRQFVPIVRADEGCLAARAGRRAAEPCSNGACDARGDTSTRDCRARPWRSPNLPRAAVA
jgi:hypothetical protein